MKIFGYDISIGREGKTKSLEFSGIGWSSLSQLNVNKHTLYDLYRQNPDIRSCTRKIAQYVGKKGIFLRDEDGQRVEYADKKEEYDRVRLLVSNPTFTLSRVELFKHLLTCGELYLLPTISTDKKINGFQILHPKSITKIIKDGRIGGFLQTVAGQTKFYDVASLTGDSKTKTNSILYFQLEKHTDNELNGMGYIEGLLYDALSDLEASKRNYYFFENGATPPSMIVLEDGLSQEALNILAEQFKAKYSGSENAHKPFFGVGVKDIKSITLTPKDMEHIQQKKMTISKICSAYGVPKALLGYTDEVNYNNANEMAREFIEGTIAPQQELLEYILNEFVQTYFDSFDYEIVLEPLDYRDVFELDKIRLAKLQSGALTLNEYRELDGREPYALDEASMPMVPRNNVFLEDLTLDPVLSTDES